MIELLFRPSSVERRTWESFVAGVIFTAVSGLLVWTIGTPSPCATGLGFLVVAFVTLAAAPLFVHVFRAEEQEFKRKGLPLLEKHAGVIEIFGFFFLGIVVATSLAYVLLPQGSANYLFSDQAHELKARQISGYATEPAAPFGMILVNNLKVLGLSFIFSLAVGAGAVFLIAWNASVLGVLIGRIANELGGGALGLLYSLPVTIITILPHGLFEFVGYFLGAVAGGVLSVAIVRERILTNFEEVSKDATVFLLVATAFIVIGAVIEVLI